MASELTFRYATTGLTTLYAVLELAGSFVKASDGSLVTASTANFPNGKVALSDSVCTGRYVANMPAGVAAGSYAYNVYQQIGGSPADSDTVVGEGGSVDWTGSATTDVVAVNAKTTNLPAEPASTTNITAGTITTVTNLTNAPTSGDFTAAMKTSLNSATPAANVLTTGTSTGGNTTTTLNLAAVSIPADSQSLVGATVYISAGAAAGISRIITAFNNNTHVATIDSPWGQGSQPIPDGTSTYVVVAGHQPAIAGNLSVIADSVTNSIGGNVVGSVGALAAQAKTDVQSALTAQGLTTARAGYLDTLNGLVAAIWNALTSGMSTAGSIGKKLADWVIGTTQTADVATRPTAAQNATATAAAILATPANLLATDSSGRVTTSNPTTVRNETITVRNETVNVTP